LLPSPVATGEGLGVRADVAVSLHNLTGFQQSALFIRRRFFLMV
jgi:hypothetical protein